MEKYRKDIEDAVFEFTGAADVGNAGIFIGSLHTEYTDTKDGKNKKKIVELKDSNKTSLGGVFIDYQKDLYALYASFQNERLEEILAKKEKEKTGVFQKSTSNFVSYMREIKNSEVYK